MTRNKYGNEPTTVNGIRFASQVEARRDAELVLLERAGEITGLARQPSFYLAVNGVKICIYRGDWSYCESGKRVVEDRKGVQTAAFKIKWKLCQALYPDIIWRMS